MSNRSNIFRRAIVLVVDSLGIGALPDAAAYNDEGSDTLGNIAQHVRLRLPELARLGLGRVARLPEPTAGVPAGAFGRMKELSPGKDSVTGHWELMGVVLDRAFAVYPNGFPQSLIDRFEARIGRATLGNTVASGTQIIDALGSRHLDTGFPIVYTSADSVFQVAAHEEVVPLDDLYRFCEAAYALVTPLGVSRVIARPFVGAPGAFRRTVNRRDFALPPTGETLLDRLSSAGITVHAIGKIWDLFAGRGISQAVHTSNDDEVMNAVSGALGSVSDGLIFANLVDSDMLYGHRNDVAGYAANLERFDARLAVLLPRLGHDDLLIVTADHGNDPTTPSTDHSREYVPLLVSGAAVRAGVDLGTRATFADLAQTLADIFGVGQLRHGTSFLRDLSGMSS